MPEPGLFSDPILHDAILGVIPAGQPIYLVGGSVRDALLQREMHDFDFAVPKDALQFARRLANALGAAFYPLDEVRNTGRVIWNRPANRRTVIDVALLRGKDLEEDLRARDFTINAMAIELRQPQMLIDPLGGLQDLRSKILRVCAPSSLVDDPLRLLRAIRLVVDFSLKISAETKALMRQAAPRLSQVTPERVRDEIFRILDSSHPQVALRLLSHFKALAQVLPELETLPGVKQPAPHIMDVWEHTLTVVQRLSTVLNLLSEQYDPDASGNLTAGLLTVRLGRFRQQVQEHIHTQVGSERSLRSMLNFAALYHDVGKPQSRKEEPGGRVHFYEHEKISAGLFSARAHALRLSTNEIHRIRTIILHHMRPLWLANSTTPISRRAIYRFYRDTGAAGIDICLFSLGDVWATYGHTLPQGVWRNHLDAVRLLMNAWWEQNSQLISPPLLINGHDLIQALALEPGPQVGRLLEAIREAQAEGKVVDREGAIALARTELLQGKP